MVMTESQAQEMVYLLEGVSVHGWKWQNYLFDEGDSFSAFVPQDQSINALITAIVTNGKHGLPLPGYADDRA